MSTSVHNPDKHIFNQVAPMDRAIREAAMGQRGCVLWLTGLSGSGKSTISRALELALVADGHAAFVLDGDEIRSGLNKDLGFSPQDRQENIRRISEISKLFADCGVICITAFISPLKAHRAMAREIVGADRFFEVFIDADVKVCEKRDPKGLYKKARAGKIPVFTGIAACYEPPETPDVRIDTTSSLVEQSVWQLVHYVASKGFITLKKK
ncbi:MAG TPA: adenylyl-sulfate kinase [Kiritimatiellia bacterium]|jgi:adenylylsulfate kinase